MKRTKSLIVDIERSSHFMTKNWKVLQFVKCKFSTFHKTNNFMFIKIMRQHSLHTYIKNYFLNLICIE